MGRRSHKKSRLGCVECKRRHRKCDESYPICANCSAAQLQCSYAHQKPPSVAATHSTTISPRALSPGAASISPSPLENGSIQPLASRSHGHIDMHHMELLSHFLLDTYPGLGINTHGSLKVSVASALATPYLMYEMLAFAAQHLSFLRPAQAKFYRDQAVDLQAQSITLFNDARSDLTPETCIPMFIFSSLLGVHMLADAVAAPGSNFLDKFIVYMEIHRGVCAITSQTWHLLCKSEFSDLLLQHQEALALGHQGQMKECDGLKKLLDSADISQSSFKACLEAVRYLQATFDSQTRQTPELQASGGTVFAWPLRVSADFVDLLSKRSPEALIILAHFATLLHNHRGLWVFGNAGQMLIESITAHLGTYWKDWLSWPNAILTADSCAT